MSRTCTVCRSEARQEIDQALIAGQSEEALAARYRPLSRSAIQRHREGHLPARLVEAQGAADAANADDLLRDELGLQARLTRLMDAAEADRQRGVVVSAAREVVRILDLRWRMAGPTIVPAEFEHWAASLAASLGHNPATFMAGLREDLARHGYLLPSMADSVENHPRVSDG
jgi:hypothetical protein